MGYRFLQRGVLFSLIVGLFGGTASLAAGPGADPALSFSMHDFKSSCNEATRLYASCADQNEVLAAGLDAAKAEGQLALVVLGFNDCPPCYVIDRWLNSDDAKALIAPFTLIKVSILDPERDLRSDVFDGIIPKFSLPIANRPPFGVPYFVLIDPKTNKVVGEGISGFNSKDQSKHIAYLKAHGG